MRQAGHSDHNCVFENRQRRTRLEGGGKYELIEKRKQSRF
jgi:hypothetical protein